MSLEVVPVQPEVSRHYELDEIEIRLQGRLSGRVRNLQLILRAHGVVLRGLTRTYYNKQLAQHAVMETLDLPIVANEIEVS